MSDAIDERIEKLGPAELIIKTITSFTDHMVHNRPGFVFDDNNTIGKKWLPAYWKMEDEQKVIYGKILRGRGNRLGILDENNIFMLHGKKCEYRGAGIFPEVVAYLYRQIADIWKLDNEFVARLASWSFNETHRDLKVILTAFMLVQNKCGIPIKENGEILFYDDDYRDVGEAMCLIKKSSGDLSPKLLFRISEVLELPEVIEINRELSFGKSSRNPFYGRYYRVVTKWLQYRENNLPLLEGLVKSGYRTTVMKLARKVGYKPISKKFFEILRWKQAQSKDGRRSIAIGEKIKEAETWAHLNEEEICGKIVELKYDWKKIKGMIPPQIGFTRAIITAAVESGCMSDKDLIIMTPTLEEFDLLKIKSVKLNWEIAIKNADDRRAANIARNVKSKDIKDKLEDAADQATSKALEEVTKNLRIYCMVDISGSMENAIDKAKAYLKRLLVGFPLDQLHVSVFNTIGKEVKIKSSKAAAIEHAFNKYSAGGGTSYASGVYSLVKYIPKNNEDALMIFIGDELDNATNSLTEAIRASKINPIAIGLLKINSNFSGFRSYQIVHDTADRLGVPLIPIDENMFESDDPYAITRILRNLIDNTPVGVRSTIQGNIRSNLIYKIMETPLLQKPAWA
jgi:hypothetical protein